MNLYRNDFVQLLCLERMSTGHSKSTLLRIEMSFLGTVLALTVFRF